MDFGRIGKGAASIGIGSLLATAISYGELKQKVVGLEEKNHRMESLSERLDRRLRNIEIRVGVPKEQIAPTDSLDENL